MKIKKIIIWSLGIFVGFWGVAFGLYFTGTLDQIIQSLNKGLTTNNEEIANLQKKAKNDIDECFKIARSKVEIEMCQTFAAAAKELSKPWIRFQDAGISFNGPFKLVRDLELENHTKENVQSSHLIDVREYVIAEARPGTVGIFSVSYASSEDKINFDIGLSRLVAGFRKIIKDSNREINFSLMNIEGFGRIRFVIVPFKDAESPTKKIYSIYAQKGNVLYTLLILDSNGAFLDSDFEKLRQSVESIH